MSVTLPAHFALWYVLEDDLLLALTRTSEEPSPPASERVHPLANRVYAELPLAYQDTDEQLGWPLLLWLSTLLDQAGEVTDLYDRINSSTLDEGGAADETSDLGNPATAESAWLPWLAQHVGIRITGLTLPEQRAAIGSAASGFAVGTKGAIAAAARTALTGSQFVRVYDHTISEPGDGGEWDVLVVTRSEETPDVTAVLDAIEGADAKPAGVTLRQRSYSATWTSMTTAYPTWADRNGHTWLDIEEAGL